MNTHTMAAPKAIVAILISMPSLATIALLPME